MELTITFSTAQLDMIVHTEQASYKGEPFFFFTLEHLLSQLTTEFFSISCNTLLRMEYRIASSPNIKK